MCITFEKLKDKKIVLNRSVLNEQDIRDFEYESRSKIYFNMQKLLCFILSGRESDFLGIENRKIKIGLKICPGLCLFENVCIILVKNFFIPEKGLTFAFGGEDSE